MKKKIVLKVAMGCKESCITKAHRIAAKTTGVNYVELEGSEKGKLVVIGDEFDPVKLVIRLREKVGLTEIISVGKVDNIYTVGTELLQILLLHQNILNWSQLAE